MVVSVAAQHGWDISLADVSTAFLQGMTFEELRNEGLKRQPVAFTPDGELWWILGTLDPNITFEAAKMDEPTMEMDKCGYGLKDAVLYWYIRADRLLKSVNWKSTL